MIRVLLVDDQSLLRMGFRMILDVRLGRQDHREAQAEQGLVIDEQHPDHGTSPPSRRSRAETFQPAGWRGPACTSPP